MVIPLTSIVGNDPYIANFSSELAFVPFTFAFTISTDRAPEGLSLPFHDPCKALNMDFNYIP